MRLFYFDDTINILLCFLLWLIFQLSTALLSLKIPDHFFRYDNLLFKTRKFEKNGALYKSAFKIAQWKKYLPDGAAVRKSGYRKKKLTDFSIENLKIFLVESCRAELGHLLAILPFWTFGLFLPKQVVWIMLIYAIVVNGPCIIAQRFNRPRIIKLLEKMERRNNHDL